MKNTDSTENANTTAIKEITFIEETSPESEIATSATTSQVVSSLKAFTANCDIPTVWEENGKYCGTCKFTVTNGTDNITNGWTVRITVPNGLEITDSWNGVFTLKSTSVIVTNESYNGVLEKGGTAEFGFNFASPEKVSSFLSIASNSGAPVIDTNYDGNQTSALDEPLPAPVPVGFVNEHGKLSVKGAQLVDKNGNNFQLKGMSTHGINWFPDFVNEGAFKTLRDDWKINAVRLAMYTEISSRFKNYDNVIYELCNEPNGNTSWSGDIKPYAQEVMAVIRKNAPDSVVIVGTPTWSQDIDKAADDPLTEGNVLYSLHFYAATHTDWLRERLTECYNKGLPVFVSEFGTCDASGNGAHDFEQAKQWLDLLDTYGIGYMNWNLANKNESSSVFKENASTDGNWKEEDLSEGGIWIRKWFRGE